MSINWPTWGRITKPTKFIRFMLRSNLLQSNEKFNADNYEYSPFD